MREFVIALFGREVLSIFSQRAEVLDRGYISNTDCDAELDPEVVEGPTLKQKLPFGFSR